MSTHDINTIDTAHGALRYYRDWDNCEGSVIMLNAQTIARYKQIKDECSKVDLKKFDCFFAFSDEKFAEGLHRIRPLSEGEKLVRLFGGAFATKDGAERLSEYYRSIDEKIKQECDPQEVYFYEYNNHECMFSWDGDKDALNVVIKYWGEEVASKIVRL